MKRSREVKEAALYINGLRADDEGSRVPLVLGHEDILQTMLANHPYSLLQVLKSTKALYGLLRHVNGFWYALLDAVVVKETGEANWAFYAWEWHTGLLRHWMRRVLRLPFGSTDPYYAMKAPWFCYLRLLINVEREAGGKTANVLYRRQLPWAGDDWRLGFEFEYYDPADFWEYTHEDGWVPDERYEGDETADDYLGNDQIRARFFVPPVAYMGYGADITAPMPGDAPSTSLCEIASYRMRDEWHDSNDLDPGSLTVLSLRLRQELCRLYTYFHPFALGPFELLDTRRLWLHRLYVAFLCEGGLRATHVFSPRRAKSIYNDVLHRLYEHAGVYGTWIEELGGIARLIERSRDPSDEGCYDPDRDVDQLQIEVLADWGMDAVMAGAEEALVKRIQDAVDSLESWMMPAGWEKSPQPVFTQTRALLAQRLPDAGTMLELATYKQHLMQYYAEPAATRRLLERELAYLEHTKGRPYVVQQYGRASPVPK